MQVHYSANKLPPFKNAIVTIGTFDGVHLGHRQIIQQLKEQAQAIHGETVIITFHPHPRSVVASNKPLHLLTTLHEKIILLEQFGIDHLIVVPFDEKFSSQSPEDYVEKFLFEKCRPHTLIIGYDHRFGKNRKGDYHLLETLGEKLGFEVKEIPEQVIDEVTVSSTRIREALLKADLATANSYLGYKYFFEGMVVDGNKLGRTLGYPTANIAIYDEEKLVPANGIYVAEAQMRELLTDHSLLSIDNSQASNINNESLNVNDDEQLSAIGERSSENGESNGQLLQGMLSIGVRPTVDGKNRTIELNIFNFKDDIYGRTIKVYLLQYLRPEAKFETLDDLKLQMNKDRQNSLAHFKQKL